ncbi:sigma-70 family RNA polymerase sigma factor [Kitasatospora sp. NPDC052896]|uniref:sigma-70 family RNA polymerase sigma factor n=1 Tax=Kitasatospora sp. NPDC052896 TaxID=3364061 RepID=UPI0037C9C3C0
MDTERYGAAVAAAQAGDRQAGQELIAGHLPLVYNIVGRALNGHPDTDDVVQETMLHAVDGLAGLREPAAFRSWLVAIAMNQVRRRHRAQQAAPARGALDDARDLADPGADFVGATIVRLGLAGQRREVAEATRWLDPEDGELLALWWQEAAGELGRTELAGALELTPQHAAVRVQRMRERLDTARLVVRALAAAPGCAELAALTRPWDRVPAALWRKRIARHVRACPSCRGQAHDLVPAEGLLAGLALLPLPRHPHTVSTSGSVPAPARTGTSASPTSDATHPGRAGAGPRRSRRRTATTGHRTTTGHRRSAGAGRRRRTTTSRRRLAALALGALATATAAGLVWDGLTPVTHDPGQTAATGPVLGRPAALDTLGSGLPPVAVTVPSNPVRSGPASPDPAGTAVGTPSATASPSASPATTTAAPPSAAPSTTAPAVPSATAATSATPAPRAAQNPANAANANTIATFAQQVLDLVNTQRAQNGCGPLSIDPQLQQAAQGQSVDMAVRHFFDHTNPDGAGPQQRIDATGYHWSLWGENIAQGQTDPAAVMGSWMNSPGHRANILNCGFKQIGIGVQLGPGGPWWTQDFGAPA